MAVEKYAIEQCPNLRNLGESACYLALASCGALLRHLQLVEQLIFMPSTLRIHLRPNDHAIILDIATLDALEILQNARVAAVGPSVSTSKMCLLNVVDHTVTRAGKRFLRRALLEPCATLDRIQHRQEVVEVLSNAERVYNAIRTVLGTFPDLERSIAALMNRENARLRLIANRLAKSDSNIGDTESDDEGEHHAEGGQSFNEEDEYAQMEQDQQEQPEQPGQDGQPDQREQRQEQEQEDGQEEEEEVVLARDKVTRNAPSMMLIQNIVNIKAALCAVKPLLLALEGTQCDLLKAMCGMLRTGALSTLEQKIGEVVEEEAMPHKELERMRIRAAFAVKEGRRGKCCTLLVSHIDRSDLLAR